MPLRVLHLSDIHFSTKLDDEKIVHTDVRDQLLNDLRDVMLPRVGIVNKVLIAGDIAFSGKRAEYEQATSWLEQITSVCGCAKTDVLTVPGNHDVDRQRILPATKMIHRRLRTCSLPEAKRELVELANQNDGSLTDKLTDYQAFASIYGCAFESLSRPQWSLLVPLENDLTLKFVGLTTVQVCDSDDQKAGLLLGAQQYVIERNPGVEVIVVMHHPPEWIKDRQDAFQYLDSRARVQVFGHEHFQDIQRISSANQETRLVICSGAVTPEHAAEPYIYRYNILEFALGADSSLEIAVYPRVWIPETTRFEADRARIGGLDSATFNLPCPQFKLPPAPPKPGAGAQPAGAGHDPDAFARLNYFFWRYLSWQDQLKVVVKTNILPAATVPNLQTLARMGLETARRDGKLRQLWDKIMPFVPADKREPNPFANADN